MKNVITQVVATALKTPDKVDAHTTKDLKTSVIDIINWVIGLLGIVCVIVIVIGGIQYMTSTGDPGKVKKARDTILYGIIGLIIVILAAVIVNFVIISLTGGSGGEAEGSGGEAEVE